MNMNQDPKPRPSERNRNEDSVSKVFDPHRWLMEFEQEKTLKKGSHGGPQKRRSNDEVMLWNLVSSVVDLLFVSLMLVSFMWGVGQLLQVSVKGAVMNLWQISQGGTLGLFLSFFWVYYVATPAIFVYTPGQWACQITRTPKTLTFRWLVRSSLRLLALLMTGFVLLPLFSWASGQDLEGQLTGVKLVTK